MSETWVPVTGTPYPIRFLRADEADLIPWLVSKGLSKGEVAGFVRNLMREQMLRERASILVEGGTIDEVAARIVSQLLASGVVLGNPGSLATTVERSDRVSNAPDLSLLADGADEVELDLD